MTADTTVYNLAVATLRGCCGCKRYCLTVLLESHHGNVTHVAAALGWDRSNVRRLARRLGLDLDTYRRQTR